jgi:hypothetical protein
MKTSLSFLLTIIALFAAAAVPRTGLRAHNQEGQSPRTTVGRCDPTSHSIANLSGVYAGEIEIPARSPTKAKLEIKEGEFKLTTLDGTTISGTVSAVTTCDYTSAAFRVLDAAGNGEEVQKLEGRTFSLRAKLGKSLSLTNTAGEKFTFRFKCDCNTCTIPKRCGCCGG